MTGFLYKTEPYKHQREVLTLSADREAYALLMSMRTGKTKVIIDTGTHLYGRGKIDAVVVLAPKGVHRNWVSTELPIHCPPEVSPVAEYWRGNNTKKDREAWERLFDPGREGLRYATMNFDAVITPKGKNELKRLLTTFRCLYVLDESHRIKTPGIQRTKTVLGSAKYAPYRRILTGTALTNGGPLDLYTQFKFLDPYILGHSTYTSFRATYAVTDVVVKGSAWAKLYGHYSRRGIEPPQAPTAQECRAAGLKLGRDYFEKVTGYDNIATLQRSIAPHASIVTRDMVEDMPAIVRDRIEAELTPDQKRAYQQMLRESVAELAPPPDLEGLSLEEQIAAMLRGGDSVRASNALTKILRLAQILGGHVPDDDGTVHALPSNRLKVVMDKLEDIDGKVIIWSRFRAELAELEEAIAKEYGPESVVAYHGGVGDDAREEAKQRFQDDPTCRYFVGNPKSGGTGLPLHAADTMIYYSCEPSAETRWQSEERATKAGKHLITVLDVVAPSTVDEKVLEALAGHKAAADGFYGGLLTNDKLG
jgi:hypothetical protein